MIEDGQGLGGEGVIIIEGGIAGGVENEVYAGAPNDCAVRSTWQLKSYTTHLLCN